MHEKLQLIWKAQGYLDAQMIKNYLESFGVTVYVFEESVGKTFGFTVGPLGVVEIFVLKEQANEAQEILNAYLNEPFDSAADSKSEPEP